AEYLHGMLPSHLHGPRIRLYTTGWSLTTVGRERQPRRGPAGATSPLRLGGSRPARVTPGRSTRPARREGRRGRSTRLVRREGRRERSAALGVRHHPVRAGVDG